MTGISEDKSVRIGDLPGLPPAARADRLVALGLTLWVLGLSAVSLLEVSRGPARSEINPWVEEGPSLYGFILMILSPIYTSAFCALFLRGWMAKILSVLLVGLPLAWAFPIYAMLDRGADRLEPVMLPAIVGVLASLILGVIYLATFWIFVAAGRTQGPSFRLVVLQFVIVLLLIAIAMLM